jgi:hypothetical protein
MRKVKMLRESLVKEDGMIEKKAIKLFEKPC